MSGDRADNRGRLYLKAGRRTVFKPHQGGNQSFFIIFVFRELNYTLPNRSNLKTSMIKTNQPLSLSIFNENVSMKTLKVLFLMAVVGVTSSVMGHAQSYDDDIYYTAPSKKEAKKASKPTTASTSSNGYGVTTVYDYPAADTYTVLPSQGGAIMDVDAYNRRGFFATDTISVNDLPQYERIASQYYYPDAATVNIDGSGSTIYTSGDVNVVNATPSVSYVYGNPYYNTWYGYNYYNPWYTPGWYDPWYRPGWSISWGWNNYWGPSWSWGWNYPWGGPSWYPGWRPTPPPSHRPGWRPGRPSPGRNDLRPGRLPYPGNTVPTPI